VRASERLPGIADASFDTDRRLALPQLARDRRSSAMRAADCARSIGCKIALSLRISPD
jgi:hypothetical protein